jgi:hypothetical protein
MALITLPLVIGLNGNQFAAFRKLKGSKISRLE